MRIFSQSLLLRNTLVKMASAPKRIKLSSSSTNTENETKTDVEGFMKSIQDKREETAESILKYKFNKKRVRIISQEQLVLDNCEGIVYWMSRDSRVQDNWAFLFAQKLALKNEVPLHVCFCIIAKYLDASVRQFHFLLRGLEKVAADCKKLNISFHLLEGSGADALPQWVEKHNIGAVVCDFNPLRVPLGWLDGVKKKMKKDVPLIQVDAHNVVPCWVASDKQEYSARTIRKKITSKLDEFLTEFPPVIKHPYTSKFKPEPIDWAEAIESREADKTVGPVDWAKPGYDEAIKMLKSFLDKRLKIFASKRNDPTVDALSNLSPWFHFGQISVQRVALCVQEYKSKHTESVNSFLEEAIVRRELADNFCFYSEHYDSIKGASAWAQKTLDDHRKDKRTHLYTLEELSNAKTHDDLWNSAQLQLAKEGKMHGFLRMYWCKKILEWTPTPEDALKYAIYLNDHYSIDGRDPNGYVGCMWSICGIHDQGWAERAVFGKVRYMNYDGCKRKFNIHAFIARYGGKAHKYVPKKNSDGKKSDK
ncbi:deoxyribodipyrimidine photo-lyase [Amyelois transitella]|uniref:deoxyribodipyrimidine photo-lyase n=1 Tax=Amyelois transitella TaxID=680683 RepID=UPI0029907CE7|nr:deoxyribodipyrimidine photo-lyase [Amyelois transitella]